VGDQVWEVDRHTVRIPPGVYAGLLPVPGKRVEVKGVLDGGEVRAASIRLLPDLQVQNTLGIIVSLPAAGLLGEWQVDRGGGQLLKFRVESSSVVDTRAAPAVVGMLARLRLQDAGDGSLPVAQRVRVDWPD
jgi:hypothetical protein